MHGWFQLACGLENVKIVLVLVADEMHRIHEWYAVSLEHRFTRLCRLIREISCVTIMGACLNVFLSLDLCLKVLTSSKI